MRDTASIVDTLSAGFLIINKILHDVRDGKDSLELRMSINKDVIERKKYISDLIPSS